MDNTNRCILQQMLKLFGGKVLRETLDEIDPPSSLAELSRIGSEMIKTLEDAS
jgi:hypothetical protein